jgi:hypothetical protein
MVHYCHGVMSKRKEENVSTKINISKDYSSTPGARYKKDGPFSGEDFREKMLEPLFIDEKDQSKIEIVLDGSEGYPTSFLEEAFGGLARKYGIDRCLNRLVFITEEDKLLIEEILGYIRESNS